MEKIGKGRENEGGERGRGGQNEEKKGLLLFMRKYSYKKY